MDGPDVIYFMWVGADLSCTLSLRMPMGPSSSRAWLLGHITVTMDPEEVEESRIPRYERRTSAGGSISVRDSSNAGRREKAGQQQ